jgi:lysophospholipase L1-like esterase
MANLTGSLLILAFTFTAAAQAPSTDAPAAAPRPPRAAAAAPAPIVPTVVPPALTGPVTYSCGPDKGATVLTQTSKFTPTSAGFDLGAAPAMTISSKNDASFCSAASADKPFYFSIPVPPGNYRITMDLGGKEASVITIRAEARRLMLEKIPVAAGKTVTKSIDVNVRIPEFAKPDGTPGRVRLKSREVGNLDWDPKLTLEFNGINPAFHSLTIQPITEPTIYLAGDSTMVDQDVEPWASWGQQLPRFFLPGVTVANHAESGEASNSFVSEQRFAEIMSLIKPGDYFFVQFAHNDQKNGPDFPEKYRAIMTDFVTQVRAKGATPVLVTAMNRDDWGTDGKIRDSLEPYPRITREIAAATNTALIDLNAMSMTMFNSMGKDGADHAFMKFKAGSYPGVERDISDSTHFNNYGAYELARCIVQGIKDDKLSLAGFIDPATPAFDPAKPDPFAGFHLPYTPQQTKEDTTAIPQANLK